MLRVYLKRDASTRFFQCSLHALVRDGQDQGICVLARDITKERENEARFTELFETLQEGVYVAGPTGNSKASIRRSRACSATTIARTCSTAPSRTSCCEPEQWEAEQRELAQSGSIHAMRSRCAAATAPRSPACTPPRSIRDTAGRVRRHQGTLVDITERREMEQRLHREQEFARRLVESFPDLVVAARSRGPLHVRQSAIA